MIEPEKETMAEFYTRRRAEAKKQYGSSAEPSPWRVYACEKCKICWWHPVWGCPNCGTKLVRFPSVGKADYAEIAAKFPDYKNGGY